MSFDFNVPARLRSSRTVFAHVMLLGALATFLPCAVSGATIQGRVFVDQDRNGVAGAAEQGLGGVAVSDGRTVVVTAASGAFQIEVTDAPFVFVVLPRGYRAHAHRFYIDAKSAGPFEFALVDWPESRADTIRLAQISDTHVGRTNDTVETFVADIAEINALEPRAAFVLATGDLVNQGAQTSQFESYVEGMASFELPLFNLPGNHDVNSKEGLEHYHRYLGPDNYSFNAGNCHFLLLNFLRLKEPKLQQWIARDLAAAPKGATLVVGMHGLPTEEQMKQFAQLGAGAVLSGHWHGHRVRESRGIMDLNTPPLRFGGIDRHPRSFRVVEIAGGEVRNELRLGGFKQQGVVVSPAGPIAPPASGKIPVVVNAYDTRVDVASVIGELGGQRVNLRKASAWTWLGELPVPRVAGSSQVFRAEIRATNGQTWRAESTFTFDGSSAAPLRLKWAAPTGGFIGLSAPRLGEHGVAIGADDLGDLKSCGVVAFDLNGRKRWHFNTDSAIKNNIATARGRIFATSVAGWLYALDEKSGRLLWKAELDRARARWEIAATTVANGVVYAGALVHIAAFDEKTGERLWATKQGALDWSPATYPIPTIAQDKLLLFHLRWGGFALEARTGKLAWKLEGDFAGAAVNDDTIYTVHNNLPTALELHSGKVLWTGKDKIPSSGSKPCLAGDRVVIGSSDGKVAAFSKADGRLLWSTKTGPSVTSLQPYVRGGSDVSSTPAVEDGKVYVGASDGELHVLSLADGSRLGSHRLGVPIASSPLIADGTLYVGGYDGNLYAFAIDGK